MTGKILAGSIVLTALVAGIAMYYLQVYAYYYELPAEDARVELVALSGETEEIPVEDFQGIDSNSSPLRYRACFNAVQSQAMLTETYQIYDAPVPLVAPRWFDCFDAVDIGEALERGDAIAFLSVKNIHPGFDRVVAVTPDGHGFVWHQINACGENIYDGAAEEEDDCLE